jgi:uncharacterized protein with ParB-like and HNH nuclease domain
MVSLIKFDHFIVNLSQGKEKITNLLVSNEKLYRIGLNGLCFSILDSKHHDTNRFFFLLLSDQQRGASLLLMLSGLLQLSKIQSSFFPFDKGN